MATKWTKAKIARYKKEGRGKGELSSYLPWLTIRDINSDGEATEEWSTKLQRRVTLLSGIERKAFAVLEWLPNVVDIWEQFPLDEQIAMDIAKSIGIAYPNYPRTNLPSVLTVDFMVTKIDQGIPKFIAIDVKPESKLNLGLEFVKNLELHRAFCEKLNIEHRIITEREISDTLATNLLHMRGSLRTDCLHQGDSAFWNEMQMTLKSVIAESKAGFTLRDVNQHVDKSLSLEDGTSWTACMQLMMKRELSFELNDIEFKNIETSPIEQFIIV